MEVVVVVEAVVLVEVVEMEVRVDMEVIGGGSGGDAFYGGKYGVKLHRS